MNPSKPVPNFSMMQKGEIYNSDVSELFDKLSDKISEPKKIESIIIYVDSNTSIEELRQLAESSKRNNTTILVVGKLVDDTVEEIKKLEYDIRSYKKELVFRDEDKYKSMIDYVEPIRFRSQTFSKPMNDIIKLYHKRI